MERVVGKGAGKFVKGLSEAGIGLLTFRGGAVRLFFLLVDADDGVVWLRWGKGTTTVPKVLWGAG